MKKRLFISTMVSLCCLALQAQVLPEPAVRFDFKPESLTESQITASKGTAIGTITDGNSVIQTDAEIVSDPIRGNVLKLPNIANEQGTGGDQKEAFRSLKISNPIVEENTPSLIADGDYAISFWVKAAPTGVLNGYPPVMEFEQLPFSKSYALRVNAYWSTGSNKTSLLVHDNNDRKIATTYTSDSHIFAWTHILLQRSDSENNVYMYVNGKYVGKSFYNGKITDLATADKCVLNESLKYLRFNSMAHGGFTYLSDIQIFNAFLNEAQIAELQKASGYEIKTAAYPAETGTVTPSFTTEKDSEASVSAQAGNGYVFSHWINGDTIISREATYNFKATGNQVLTAIFRTPEEIQPALQITGAHYQVQPMRNGSAPFLNRPMQFQNASAALIGQQYTQINAYSTTTNPAPLSELYAKAETDGYIYVLVNDGQEDLKEIINSWATAGQWEKVEHLNNAVLYHTALPTDQYSVYKKAVKAQEWTKIEQTLTFSGALLIAPSLTSVENEIQKDQNSLTVEGIVDDRMLETIQTSLETTTTSLDLTNATLFNTTALSFSANPHLFVFLPTNAPEGTEVTGAIGIKEAAALNPVELDGTYSFEAPQNVTATVSYIRSFTAISGEDSDTETNGWQSLVLPFDATDITAIQNGETIHLTPFQSWDGTQAQDSKRPFWLYKAENGHFTPASSIEANTAYLIAIPNSDSYDAFFNVTGEVTFHGSAITATALSQGDNAPGYTLIPNFAGEKQNVYALSPEGNQWVGAQSISSFHAYATTTNGAAPQFIPIFGEDGIPTSIKNIPADNTQNGNPAITVYTADGGVTIHSLNPGSIAIFSDNGSLLNIRPISEGDNFIALPGGKYIINSNVVLVK